MWHRGRRQGPGDGAVPAALGQPGTFRTKRARLRPPAHLRPQPGAEPGTCRPFLVPWRPGSAGSWAEALTDPLSAPAQVDLPHKATQEASSKKFEDALSLIHSAWQRSDSLCRGRASRDPWC